MLPSPCERRRVVLIVGGENGSPSLDAAIRREGFETIRASSQRDVDPELARSVAAVIVDLRLFSLDSLLVARRVSQKRPEIPLLLVGEFLTLGATVVALRAADGHQSTEVDAPDEIVSAVRTVLDQRDGSTHASWLARQLRLVHLESPRSPSERWTRLVLAACESDSDFKTLAEWATLAAVSQTNLCETCRLAGIRPHDARDFARLLRAVIRASLEACPPALLLDVGDSRTLRTLLARGGLAAADPVGPESLSAAIEGFLRRQRYIDQDNLALRLVHARLVASPTP